MRIAFSIIFNGIHHLQHNNFTENMVKNFDLWILAEGLSLNQGSTKWCNNLIESDFHHNGRSIDGTIDYLIDLQDKKDNVLLSNLYIPNDKYMKDSKYWLSKDDQVNSCINLLKHYLFNNSYKLPNDDIFLWQIDVDEQWDNQDIIDAEKMLMGNNAKTGMFLCNYMVGPSLIAKGEWGQGRKLPYKRLWKWDGEFFETHEPPKLCGGNGKEITLPQTFMHYAYYFEKDVLFKSKYYNDPDIYKKWINLQENAKKYDYGYIWPISMLLDKNTYWGKTDTCILKTAFFE